MSVIGTQGAGVQLEAVVFPRCLCGKPYGKHVPAGCTGYRPERPVQHLGTRAYTPPGGWPLAKRLLARALWAVESACQGWRERL